MKVIILLTILTGWASHYSPGVFEQVMANRGMEPGEYECLAAARSPEEIGEVVLVRPVGSTKWTKCLVVDCAGLDDGGYRWMIENGVLYEVNPETVERWGRPLGFGVRIEASRGKIFSSRLVGGMLQ